MKVRTNVEQIGNGADTSLKVWLINQMQIYRDEMSTQDGKFSNEKGGQKIFWVNIAEAVVMLHNILSTF